MVDMVIQGPLPGNIQRFTDENRRKQKRWRVFKIIFFAILIALIAISTFSYKIFSSENSVLGNLGRLPVIKQFRQVLGLEDLKGELSDRINFLLLGQGGVGHEGPYLTDTIILGSFQPSTNSLALISIPRDFYLEIKGYGWRRINEANSIGEVNNYEGGGTAFTAKVVENLMDLPIHYWLRIDFNAFNEIVNDLDGINVCVDKAFEDQLYPTDDFKVQTISFVAGCQNMAGETALKFARSRHGNNNEGSDFARAARQQKIIMAIKDKFFSLGTLTSPTKIYHLFNSLKNNIQTNVELANIPHFLKMASKLKAENINRVVLDNSPKGLLSADITAEGMYVLQPRTGNFEEIQNLAKNIFIVKNGHEIEPVNLVVLNGTKIAGWAADTAGYLNSLGFDILKTGNTPDTKGQPVTDEDKKKLFEKTVVYDLKASTRTDILTVLKKSLNAEIEQTMPEFLANEIKIYTNADFLIVLGCGPIGDPLCETEEE